MITSARSEPASAPRVRRAESTRCATMSLSSDPGAGAILDPLRQPVNDRTRRPRASERARTRSALAGQPRIDHDLARPEDVVEAEALHEAADHVRELRCFLDGPEGDAEERH